MNLQKPEIPRNMANLQPEVDRHEELYAKDNQALNRGGDFNKDKLSVLRAIVKGVNEDIKEITAELNRLKAGQVKFGMSFNNRDEISTKIQDLEAEKNKLLLEYAQYTAQIEAEETLQKNTRRAIKSIEK